MSDELRFPHSGMTVPQAIDLLTKPRESYWVLELKVFAFESKEAAEKFQELLLDAFMNLPEAKEVGVSSTIKEVDE